LKQVSIKRKKAMSSQTLLAKVLPFTRWFDGYNFGKLRLDLISGITVALVLIPQSMAYAQLAGLPAYYGLYAAFLPPMIASLFGSSNQLATGPVAVVSLMSAASLEPLATAGSAEFIAYSIALALTVGIFQFSLGFLRLGLVVNFLSHPVVNGFTNAAAIIIASSQFSKFFGVQVDKLSHHYETMLRVAEAALDYTHIPTLMFGIGAVAIMVILRKIDHRIPNVLVAVVITTIISYFIGFNNDAHIPARAIKNTGIVQKIEAYNAAVLEIKTKSEQRARLAVNVEKEKRRLQDERLHKSSELVMLQSEVEIINIELVDAKQHASALRESLRKVKLIADPSVNAYYPKRSVSGDHMTSETIWRLAVDNQPLDLNNLKINGGGAIVGKIPAGLPSLALPEIKINTLARLLPVAIVISLLGFMEAIAIAKAMAAKTGQKLDPNQELIGQGLANIIGSIGSSYAISGSFSRSAVNLQAGAVTGVSSVVTSFIVVITLMFFTPLLYYLPQAVLAGVIMMAVIGLVNIKSFIHAWRAQWYDGLISITTFVVTLYFAPHLDKGIMIGVVLSMSIFMYKSMRPVVSSLSMNEEKVLQSAEYYRLQGCRHISVVRFDGALFFANASYLDEQVLKFRNDRPDLRYILLDARGINDMDASGEEALSLLVKRIRSADLGFAMCGLKGQILNVMKRTGLYDEIGRDHIYADSRAAISALIKNLHDGTDLPADGCANCPLTIYLPLAEEHREETDLDGGILEKVFAAAAFAEHSEFDTAQELLSSTTNPHLKAKRPVDPDVE
jgi:sulfate permease, SulP family